MDGASDGSAAFPAAGGDDSPALATRARAGDRAAFGALYQRFSGLVHGVLLAQVGPLEATDLVQEVFLVALRRIADLREPERIGPWLCTIARNRARDALRSPRRAVQPLVEEPSGAQPDDAGAEEILGALRELPLAYRETLVLRLVEGQSGVEIARRTGLTPGSVRVDLCRGMKLLRERLAERGGS